MATPDRRSSPSLSRRLPVTRMPSRATIHHARQAPGVVRFIWNDVTGSGDGLLVDMANADSPWKAVADVQLWTAQTDLTVARSYLDASPAVLAVFLTRQDTWHTLEAGSWEDRRLWLRDKESWWTALVVAYRSSCCDSRALKRVTPRELQTGARPSWTGGPRLSGLPTWHTDG